MFTLLIQLFVFSSVETSIVEKRGPADGTRLEEEDEEAPNTLTTLPLFSVVDDDNTSGTFSLPFIFWTLFVILELLPGVLEDEWSPWIWIGLPQLTPLLFIKMTPLVEEEVEDAEECWLNEVDLEDGGGAEVESEKEEEEEEKEEEEEEEEEEDDDDDDNDDDDEEVCSFITIPLSVLPVVVVL